MAAEVYIPSLPFISHDLNASVSLSQLSVSLFLFGMGLTGVFFGYLSDYLGRRRILLYTCSLSAVGTLLCLAAPNIYCLIAGRFIQGLGFSGVGSLSRAILRDRMSGVELARFASNLAIILVLVIDLSPFVGGFIQQYLGWRAVFFMLFSYNLLAIYLSYRHQELEHTPPSERPQILALFKLCASILRDPGFVKYNLISALTYSVIMAYLAEASFLFERVLGLTPTQFGTITLALSGVYMFGSFFKWSIIKIF